MLSSFILQSLFLLSSFATSTYASLGLVNKYCSTTNNYTDGSTFESNVNQFLSTIPENTVKNEWFYNDTIGKSPNQVYGIGMCYYDATSSDSCMSCLTEAAMNITMWCAHSTKAALWYTECFIIYSSQNFFSVESTSSSYILYTTTNASDPETFKQVLGDLMNKLSTDVATSSKLVAVGEGNYTSFQKIYGLVECTRDLPALECQKCLRVDINWIPNYCRDGILCWMFGPSCHLRYDVTPFYRPILLTPPPSPPPPPPPSLASTPPILPPPPLEPDGSKVKKKSKTIYVIIGTACSIPFVLIMMIGVFLLIRWQSRKIDTGPNPSAGIRSTHPKVSNPNFQQGTELRAFNFITLRNATNNFSEENKLGEGGFGKVYKGTVENRQELAVKRLAALSAQGITELKNEIELLGRLKHKNLVQILGYCIQEEKLLCYQYLPNGSLDKILFATDIWRRKVLNWMTRFNIIEGICRGLVYLHVDSGATIIHRDLKASNILLDESMNPKISDFGIARLFSGDKTHASTVNVAGTIGYMAPEYVMNHTFSPKSDVFSFGVLVLEIVTGRRSSTNIINYVWQHWIKKETLELIDPALHEINIDQIAKCIHIGLLCVQENPDSRPDILDINMMLHDHPSRLRPLPPGNFIWRPQMTSNFEDSIYSSSMEYTMDEFNHRQSIYSR